MPKRARSGAVIKPGRVLYEIEGLSCDAIASAFEIPVGTTYSRLHNARKRFIEAHARLEREDSAVVRLRTART